MIHHAPPDTENALRALAQQARLIAIEEIGNGERGRNNDGPAVRRYRGGGGLGSWCAHFVCWCYEEACRRRSMLPLWSHIGGAKKLTRRVASVGDWVPEGGAPQPGDVIAWHRGWPISWQGHVAFVDSHDPATDTLVTLEGNSGPYPSLVKRVRYPAGRWRRRLFGVARLWA